MPTRNLVGMVALCLAVFGGAGYLAMRGPRPAAPSIPLDKLIRRLGDPDPDLRRDAERELRRLGKKAEPALHEAAKGDDPAIAERARGLLGIRTPKPPTRVPDPPEEPVRLGPPVDQVRVTLQFASAPRRADEPVLYILRLHNDTKRAVTVARDVRFGRFERIDAEGRVVNLTPVPDEDLEDVEFVTVAPGQSVDLAPASGPLLIGAPGACRIRYVVDASDGSDYRRRLGSGHLSRAALPAERFVSNEVAVNVSP